jgi:hypothetical protein
MLGRLTVAVIFWVKSYNVKGEPAVFSVAEINIIPLGVSPPRSKRNRTELTMFR